jgi:hypothetical protein
MPGKVEKAVGLILVQSPKPMGQTHLRPVKSTNVTIVPFSNSNFSNKGVMARILATAWKRPR